MSSEPPSAALRGADEVRFEGRHLVVRFGELTYVVRGVTGAAAYLRVPVRVERGEAAHLDRVDLAAARGRKRFADAVAKKFTIDAGRVEENLVAILALLEDAGRSELEKAERPVFAPAKKLSEEDRRDALAQLGRPDLLDVVERDLTALGYVGEERAKRLVYLVSISRKLPAPLAAILRSSSGSGKSALLEFVARLAPPEDVVLLSELTPQALYYLDKDALKHKLVVVDERAGSERADYSIRTLLSRQALTLAVTQPDPATGRRRTRLVEVEGPVAYLESTTQPTINAENASRALDIFLDESPAQTRRIQEAQRRQRAGNDGAQDRATIIELHRNVQRCLDPLRVTIPFAPHLAFPSERPRHRRDHEKFLRLIEASALLRQHQRERRGDAVVAKLDDYRVAYDLAGPLFSRAMDALTPPARQALAYLRDRELLEFTRRNLVRGLGWPAVRVWRTLQELVRADAVTHVGLDADRRCRYRVLDFFASGGELTRLLPPEELSRRIGAT